MVPVHVIVTHDGQSVHVWGINDTTTEIDAELTSGFFYTHGPGSSDTGPARLPANASTLLRTLDGWEGDSRDSIAFAALRRPGHTDTRSRLILPTFKELRFAQPKLAVHTDNGTATFSGETFIWGVCLDLSGEQPLADNFFDVWPGIPYTIPWTSTQPPEILHLGNLASGAG
jgi:beta-mannosidase